MVVGQTPLPLPPARRIPLLGGIWAGTGGRYAAMLMELRNLSNINKPTNMALKRKTKEEISFAKALFLI